MREYALRIGAKTKLLNLFRRVFQLPFLERLLVRKLNRSRSFLWRKLVPPDYLYKRGAVRQTEINGIRFSLDISNVVEHLVYFGLAPENFTLVADAIRRADVIFDVGANVGSTTLFFASQNHRAGIYSFEPHPVTFQKAEANVRLNAFANIRLVNKGLGQQKETRKLYEVIANNPGMNRLMPGENPYPFVHIELTTLDDFCAEQDISKIDFIKIDVEGFEYFVLTGGRCILSQTHPVIYLELYDQGLKKNGFSAAALVALLFDWGYNRITNAYTLSPVTTDTDLTGCDVDIVAEKR